MNASNKYLTILVLVLALVMVAGCANQIPKNTPLDIKLHAKTSGALRGIDKVHVFPNLTVKTTHHGVSHTAKIPEWQYNKLVSSMRKMNFYSWLSDVLNLEEKQTNTFTLEVIMKHPQRRFHWEGDNSNTFQEVLHEFRSISREVIKHRQTLSSR